MKTNRDALGALTLAAVLLAASPVRANDKGGMGNGGIALRCPDSPTRLLDVAMPENPEDVARFRLPRTREALVSRIRARLAEFPVLRDRILAALAEFGPSEDWELGDWAGTYDAFLPRPLPAGCRLAQAAYFLDGRPRKRAETYAELSRAQRRVLELHESAFSVGVRVYRHANPVVTRELVGQILLRKADPARMREIARLFTTLLNLDPRIHLPLETKPDVASRLSFAATAEVGPTGVFRRLGAESSEPAAFRGAAGCPEQIVLESTFGRGSQAAFADGLDGIAPKFRGASLRAASLRADRVSGWDSDDGWTIRFKPGPNFARDRLRVGNGDFRCAYERAGPGEASPNYLIRLSDQGLH